MYDVVNVIIHLISFALIIYAFINRSDEELNRRETTISQMALIAGIGILSVWSLIIGIFTNFENLYKLLERIIML